MPIYPGKYYLFLVFIRKCRSHNRQTEFKLKYFSEKVPELQFNFNAAKKTSNTNEDNSLKDKTEEITPIQTLGFQRVLERAMNQVISAGKSEFVTADLLAAIFLEQDSYAVYLLKKQGITRYSVNLESIRV